jgi:hypothetical protein
METSACGIVGVLRCHGAASSVNLRMGVIPAGLNIISATSKYVSAAGVVRACGSVGSFDKWQWSVPERPGIARRWQCLPDATINAPHPGGLVAVLSVMALLVLGVSPGRTRVPWRCASQRLHKVKKIFVSVRLLRCVS